MVEYLRIPLSLMLAIFMLIALSLVNVAQAVVVSHCDSQIMSFSLGRKSEASSLLCREFKFNKILITLIIRIIVFFE